MGRLRIADWLIRASDDSIIVEICDEKIANMWRKTAKIKGWLSFVSFFFSGSSSSSRFDVYFSLCWLFQGDDDPTKPQLNFQGKRLLKLCGIIFSSF